MRARRLPSPVGPGASPRHDGRPAGRAHGARPPRPGREPASHDGTHPEESVDFGAVHGGDWRSAYNLRSTLASTGILGLPEAYAPPLRLAGGAERLQGLPVVGGTDPLPSGRNEFASLDVIAKLSLEAVPVGVGDGAARGAGSVVAAPSPARRAVVSAVRPGPRGEEADVGRQRQRHERETGYELG